MFAYFNELGSRMLSVDFFDLNSANFTSEVTLT